MTAVACVTDGESATSRKIEKRVLNMEERPSVESTIAMQGLVQGAPLHWCMPTANYNLPPNRPDVAFTSQHGRPCSVGTRYNIANK